MRLVYNGIEFELEPCINSEPEDCYFQSGTYISAPGYRWFYRVWFSWFRSGRDVPEQVLTVLDGVCGEELYEAWFEEQIDRAEYLGGDR